MERVEMGKNGDGFIDRSRVRILLCDNDEKSSEEVFTLLRKCSYQVTSVKSSRQVIDALNAEGTDIDIILSEIDLPMSKGKKLLKYIMRDKELRRIPVIMMSAQDEVAIVVKCLKLGAADYLVKPLRTNELLNLWTHMWRRRRILGLAEKNVLNYDLDLVVSDPSDPSDANTNSTTLLSDDADDKSRKSTNPETCVSTGQENEANAFTNAAPIQTARGIPPEYRCDVEERTGGRQGQRSPLPKLRIGESSAFFTYVKSAAAKRISPQHSKSLQKLTVAAARTTDNRASTENPYQTNANSPSKQHGPNDEFGHPHILPTNDSPSNSFNRHPHSASFPYFVPGMMCQVAAMHPGGPHEINHTGSRPPRMSQVAAMLPGGPHETNPVDYRSPMMIQVAAMRPSWPHEINHAGSHSPMMPPYPYYPFGICLQPGQIPGPPHPPPNRQCGPSGECGEKGGRVDRREAALMKFRRKRKERCFDKKIRYVNRKKLAERRPRLRGQFVSKVNGVTMDLNGQPGSAAEEEEEDEEDYDDDDRSNVGFSPEDEV